MHLLALLICTAAILSAGASREVLAQEMPAIPQLWDPRERLPQPDLSARPRLRFLTGTDFAPFNSLDAEGRLVGFHVDLARALCETLQMADRCQIQALPWEELQPALQRGDGDAVIAGIAVTADARRTLGFTRPYLWFPARFVALSSKLPAEPVAATLRGAKVGVLAGSAHERLLRDEFAGIEPVPQADQATLLRDLREGRTAAIFGDGMRWSFFLATEEGAACCQFAGGPFLAPEHLGLGLSIAVKREDTELAAALDAALQSVSTRGKFTELYLRHFPVSFF